MNFLALLLFTAVISNDTITSIFSEESQKANDSDVVQNENYWNGWPTENTVSEVIALYDHENNIVLYKDLSVPACFVENKENQENHSVPNFLKVLAVSNSTIASEKLIKSKFMNDFCESLPILMIKSSDSDSLHRVHRSRRRKRCEEHDRLLNLQQDGVRSRGHSHSAGGHSQSQVVTSTGGSRTGYHSGQFHQSGSTGQIGGGTSGSRISSSQSGSGQTWSTGQYLRPETRTNVVRHYSRSYTTGGQGHDTPTVVHSNQQIYGNGQLVKSLNGNGNTAGFSVYPAVEDATVSNGNRNGANGHSIYRNSQQQPVQSTFWSSNTHSGRIAVPVTWAENGQNQNVQLKFNNNGGLTFATPNDQPQPYSQTHAEVFNGARPEDYSQEYISEGRGQKFIQNGHSHSSGSGSESVSVVQNGNGHSIIKNGNGHSMILNGNGHSVTLPPNLSGFRLVTVQPDQPGQTSNGQYHQNGGGGFRQWKQSGKSVQLTVTGQAQPTNDHGTESEHDSQNWHTEQIPTNGQVVRTQQQHGSGYSEQNGGRTHTQQQYTQNGHQPVNGRNGGYLNQLNGLTIQEAGVDGHSGGYVDAETRQTQTQSGQSQISGQHEQLEGRGQARSNSHDQADQLDGNGQGHQFQPIEQSHPLIQPVVDTGIQSRTQSGASPQIVKVQESRTQNYSQHWIQSSGSDGEASTNQNLNLNGARQTTHAQQSNGGVQFQQNGGYYPSRQNGQHLTINSQPQNGGYNYNRQYSRTDRRNYGSNGHQQQQYVPGQQQYVQTQRSTGQYHPRQYAVESRPEQTTTTTLQNQNGAVQNSGNGRNQNGAVQNSGNGLNQNGAVQNSGNGRNQNGAVQNSGNGQNQNGAVQNSGNGRNQNTNINYQYQQRQSFNSTGGNQIQPGQRNGQGQSQCHLVTFTCTIINTANGRAKLCRPKGTNGSGQSGTAVQPGTAVQQGNSQIGSNSTHYEKVCCTCCC